MIIHDIFVSRPIMETYPQAKFVVISSSTRVHGGSPLQIVIADLSDYSVQAATPRHIQKAASRIASMDRSQDCRYALVINNDAVHSAWRLLIDQASLPGKWVVFHDREDALQWAFRQVQSQFTSPRSDGATDAPIQRHGLSPH